MKTKLVCRLLDASGSMLGWTIHQGHIRGDGRIWTSGPLAIAIAQAGTPAVLSVVWSDVNVEARIPCSKAPVQPGQTVTIHTKPEALVTIGEPPVGLPPITVGQSVVTVPAGGLGAAGA